MKLLCVISAPPFAGSKVIEQIEVAMVGAVFDLEVSLLLTDDGVFAAMRDQNGESLGARSPGKVISGLPMYEIDAIYVDEDALEERQLDTSQLLEEVRTLSRAEQQSLLAATNIVVSGV